MQGVGFRPHVYRLARALALGGHVRNEADAVVVEVEGTSESREAARASIPADTALCAPCSTELFDPTDRRIVMRVVARSGERAFEDRCRRHGGRRALPGAVTV